MDEDYRYQSVSFVLEYTPYGTLKEFLKGHNELTERELIFLSAQVAHGLEALHRCKICHGDIKTQNVLVFRVDDA
jgi:serine/threonine protein kinase